MSDTGIPIELSVPGFDKSMAQLMAMAAQIEKTGAAAKMVQNAQVTSQGAMNVNITSVTINANMVNFTKGLNLQQNWTQNNTWNQANQQVNSFADGLFSAKTAAVAVAGEMVAFGKKIVDAGAALANIGLLAGGTQNESAGLFGLGRAFNLDASSMAKAFSDHLSSDGMGAAFGNPVGVHSYGPLDKNQDYAERLLTAMDYIRSASVEDARRFANVEHLTGLLPAKMLTDAQYKNLRVNDPARTARIMNPEFQENMERVQYEISRVELALLNLGAAILGPSGSDLAGSIDKIANSINDMADAFADHANQIKGFTDFYIGQIKLMTSFGLIGWDDLFKGIKEMMTPSKALDRHTNSMDRHSDSLDQATRNGVYGGGERARGAIPSKWSGIDAGYYVGQAAKLGAFNL